jgi:hypothetical protein
LTKYILLRNYGIGDTIYQINRFYFMAKKFNFKPVFICSKDDTRNQIPISNILILFNIPHQILEDTNLTKKDFKWSVDFLNFNYIKADNDSDHVQYINKLLAINHRREIPAQKEVQEFIFQSDFYKKILEKRKRQKNRKITVHVRRGDVAKIPLSDNYFLTVDGVKHLDTLKEFPHIMWRDAPIQVYKKALEKIRKPTDEISLISDGFTRMKFQYKTKVFSTEFKNSEEFEEFLNEEFNDLKKEANTIIIGESIEKLFLSLTEGLTSDIVIARSPTLFWQLKTIMDLKIEVIDI